MLRKKTLNTTFSKIHLILMLVNYNKTTYNSCKTAICSKALLCTELISLSTSSRCLSCASPWKARFAMDLIRLLFSPNRFSRPKPSKAPSMSSMDHAMSLWFMLLLTDERLLLVFLKLV